MEYGGCLALELENKGELFDKYPNAKIARFNCGRNAMAAVALSIKPGKIWIPYYNCAVVRDTLLRYQVPIDYYYIDKNLEPIIENIKENEWILYVNYFGIASSEKINRITLKYERVIFDNTQALFAEPVFHKGCFNIYSPRKFVGISDGAYVVWNNQHVISEDYPIDISWDRVTFLLKCTELGQNEAYSESQKSKLPFSDGIKRMSVLTRRMLNSIDYDRVKMTRTRNYNILHEKLFKVNNISPPENAVSPFVYPLYIENLKLRKILVDNKVYVSQWWLYLLDEVSPDSVEAKYTKYLLPIPLDQRCAEEDMINLADLIRYYINTFNEM